MLITLRRFYDVTLFTGSMSDTDTNPPAKQQACRLRSVHLASTLPGSIENCATGETKETPRKALRNGRSQPNR